MYSINKMAPSQKPININITSNGEELQVPNEYNEFREYIVKNNIVLQNDIKLKAAEVKELEAKIQEHEEEENKYDSRMRYMKGLLQNLNELRAMYVNVKDKTEQKVEIIREHNKTTKTKKAFNLILSATAPLTIDAAVAQKTI